MRPGDSTTVAVETLGGDARGVARIGETELHIDGAAPGDEVVVRVDHLSTHRPVAWCSVEKVLSRGVDYLEPRCARAWPVRGRCGGCPAMHLSVQAQSRMKLEQIRQSLAQYEITAEIEWFPSPCTLGYRNRGQFVCSKSKGRVVLGSYAPRTHDVVSMEGCAILRAPLADVAASVAQIATDLDIPTHPSDNALRYVTLRASPGGDVLVDLIANGDAARWTAPLVDALMEIAMVTGVSFSTNESGGNAIRTGPSTTIAGKETIVENVGPLELEMAAASFSQLNSDVAAAMYARAAGWAGEATVSWDLYCGLGGLGLTVADGTKIFGVDSLSSSIALAEKNAARAHVEARYETADLAERFPTDWPTPDVVLVNPPRRGIDRAVLNKLGQLAADRLIYMSCSPASFARDARSLLSTGWKSGRIFAHDMLPSTTHVEIIAAFRRASD